MSDEISYHEYWQEVTNLTEQIADGCRERNPEDPESELGDVMHETIDGHSWVIYTARNFDVLRHSPNDDYSITEFGADSVVSDAGVNWAALAFGALYADVQDEIASYDWDQEDERDEPKQASA